MQNKFTIFALSDATGELANNFGNLHRRLISMIDKYHGGKVSKKGETKYFNILKLNQPQLSSAVCNFYH